jgi:hypothetical protein
MEDEIKKMLERVAREDPSYQLTEAVIDALARTLSQLKPRFGYWEKEHLAYAIAAANSNAYRAPPTKLWLTLALSSALKALLHPDQRNDAYNPAQRREITALEYKDFSDALRSLGASVL